MYMVSIKEVYLLIGVFEGKFNRCMYLVEL